VHVSMNVFICKKNRIVMGDGRLKKLRSRYNLFSKVNLPLCEPYKIRIQLAFEKLSAGV